jgi:GNAT superfamily N-acetyltransferase
MLTNTVEDGWPEDTSRVVVDGLAAFNAAHGSVPCEQKLAVLALDDDQSVVGGLLGRTDHGWFYVGWLWVCDGLRGQGVGVQLMDRAEAVARQRGRHAAHLTTLEFQAS